VASVSVLDPSRKEVRTFRRGAPARMLGAGDQLSDPDVLPGLALNVASLFSV
jgi:Uma2 family endonuclease